MPSAETEKFSLFRPARRQPRRQAHQLLGGQSRGLLAIDDGRGDVGRQPRKAQEGVEVGCRHLFFLGDVMHPQRGVLDLPCLDVVRAGKDSEQARIGRSLFIGILDQHAHFAPGALQIRRYFQRQPISRWSGRSAMRHL